MLAEFANGDLPWSKNIQGRDMVQRVVNAKSGTTAETISEGMPVEFSLLFKYVKTLQFEDRPDYSSIIEMMQNAKQKLKLNQSKFDWVLLATDPEQYDRLNREKEDVKKQIMHIKGQVSDEERKK